MVHGDCSSRGCYAMTDEQIGEIYSLAREAFLGGQKQFPDPGLSVPHDAGEHRRVTATIRTWRSGRCIKEGNDHFEVTHLEPKVDVCERHYVFDAQPPAGSTKPLVFSPTGRCPAYEVPQEIAGPAIEKAAAMTNTSWRNWLPAKRAGGADHDGHRRRHEQGLRRQARDNAACFGQ